MKRKMELVPIPAVIVFLPISFPGAFCSLDRALQHDGESSGVGDTFVRV